jgi:hypothetical protein
MKNTVYLLASGVFCGLIIGAAMFIALSLS